MIWISKNAVSIQAVAAVITAVVALVALIGINYQLDAADEVQRAQSAREAYRSHLALGVANQDYASPSNACDLLNGSRSGSYTSFVDHLLYSAEQMLEVESGWEPTFSDALAPHAAYICTADSSGGNSERMNEFLSQFRKDNCTTSNQCQ